ncbi:MAG: hypothetical protein ACAI25_10665 [Planctomycetota bacterium]
MELPSAIDKRNMLYAPDPRRPFDPLALGDAFAEKKRHPEALDFYERVADTATRAERIARIKAIVKAEGNAFVLNRIATKGFVSVSKEEWLEAAAVAKKQGQLRYALRAAIQAGDEALMAELRATLGDAVPVALAAQVTTTTEIAESPEQAKAGVTTPGQKVEAVAASGAASSHAPDAAPSPSPPTNGGEAKPQA